MFKSAETLKSQPKSKTDYASMLQFVISINQQIIDEKKDIVGNPLSLDQLKIVEYALFLAKTELSILSNNLVDQ